MRERTIAAIATPIGTGGIGIVRISGNSAISVAERVFRPYGKKTIFDIRGYSGVLGRIFDSGGDIDEAIAFVYRAPRSYTGEDVVELSCHGGLWLVDRILRLCHDNGAEPAEPGEFTKRAFLNGKLDLVQAESVMDLISAGGEAAGKAALAARDGVLSTRISEFVEILTGMAAHLSAWADYPDEDLEPVDTFELSGKLNAVLADMDALLDTAEKSRTIREGIKTVIAGKPNTGKSTIMNMLAGRERSIVTDIPGTTRDVVEENINIKGHILRLFDTAGIRETEDIIESIGVSKAETLLKSADLVLAVFDGSDLLSEWDLKLLRLIKEKPAIALKNKNDLPQGLDTKAIEAGFSDTVSLSAKTGEGRETLEKAILKAVGLHNIDLGAPILNSERQRVNLRKARDSVWGAISALSLGYTLDAVNVEIDGALCELLSLTGERAADRVVDEVFSRFCVGK